MHKKKKSRAFVHYFACRAREEPIISVCLLSGLLWDELKCEFNLLGAKVNFRRGISRCAPWGVYATLPLRDVPVGPAAADLCLATSRSLCDVEALIHIPFAPPTHTHPQPLALPAAGGFAWSAADNLDSPLQPSLSASTVHQKLTSDR